VKSIVDSIDTHGYEVAKVYFLNPIACTCFTCTNSDPKLTTSTKLIDEEGVAPKIITAAELKDTI
jgi:hypothetical protein